MIKFIWENAFTMLCRSWFFSPNTPTSTKTCPTEIGLGTNVKFKARTWNWGYVISFVPIYYVLALKHFGHSCLLIMNLFIFFEIFFLALLWRLLAKGNGVSLLGIGYLQAYCYFWDLKVSVLKDIWYRDQIYMMELFLTLLLHFFSTKVTVGEHFCSYMGALQGISLAIPLHVAWDISEVCPDFCLIQVLKW